MRVRAGLSFPDKRLIQWDCGKLQVLETLTYVTWTLFPIIQIARDVGYIDTATQFLMMTAADIVAKMRRFADAPALRRLAVLVEAHLLGPQDDAGVRTEGFLSAEPSPVVRPTPGPPVPALDLLSAAGACAPSASETSCPAAPTPTTSWSGSTWPGALASGARGALCCGIDASPGLDHCAMAAPGLVDRAEGPPARCGRPRRGRLASRGLFRAGAGVARYLYAVRTPSSMSGHTCKGHRFPSEQRS